MANWMTGSEISARYIASEQKLFDYARRGNMPMFRQDDGSILYDERHASTLFRPRGPSAVLAAPADGKPNMGVLGASRLGERAAPRTLGAERGAGVAEERVPESGRVQRFAPLALVPQAPARKAG
jgi:hypothetical protein